MKKILLSTIATVQIFAGGHIAPTQEEKIDVSLEDTHEIPELGRESDFYIVAAGLIDFGDTVPHEGVALNGDQDYGFGIDIGYRLGDGFAVEYDFTYARNSVSRTEDGVHEEATGIYYTSAIDLVYTYEATEAIGVFAKVGYEYEWETIDEYNIDTRDHDFVFGTGLEIAMNDTYKLLFEYEYSLIESPRGPSIFAGVMYNF